MSTDLSGLTAMPTSYRSPRRLLQQCPRAGRLPGTRHGSAEDRANNGAHGASDRAFARVTAGCIDLGLDALTDAQQAVADYII